MSELTTVNEEALPGDARASRGPGASNRAAQRLRPRPSIAGLVVSEVRDRRAFDKLAVEWNALAERTSDQLFFRHEFLGCWLDHFAKRGALRVLTARNREGTLVGALPLLATRSMRFGIPARELVSISNKHSCRFDLLADDPAAAGEAFLDHLSRDRSWDVLRICDVPEDGGAWSMMGAASERGFGCETWTSARSPYVALPRTIAEWEKVHPSRKALRRRRRRLEEMGKVEYLVIDTPHALDAHLSTAFAIEQSGWKGRNGTAIAQDPRTHGFYRDLAQLTAHDGRFAMAFLHLDGKPIAFQYGAIHGDRYLALKQSYLESHRTYSPGQLLMDELIKDCIRRGLTSVELHGDDTPAKREWTPRVRTHTWLFIFRDRFRGRLLRAAKFRWAPAAKQLAHKWNPKQWRRLH